MIDVLTGSVPLTVGKL